MIIIDFCWFEATNIQKIGNDLLFSRELSQEVLSQTHTFFATKRNYHIVFILCMAFNSFSYSNYFVFLKPHLNTL